MDVTRHRHVTLWSVKMEDYTINMTSGRFKPAGSEKCGYMTVKMCVYMSVSEGK